tara:strand:- start:1115 stop:2629 length:1515 start_codon:yes stop_codon:yes gene_type:complete
MKLRKTLLLIILFPFYLTSQNIIKENLGSLAEKYTKSSFPLLIDILSIPNDANFPDDIEKNIKWCENAFIKRKFITSRIETEGSPLLLAERKYKNSEKTVLIYLQVDGQPVDTTKWNQKSPYLPVVKRKNSKGEWTKVDNFSIDSYNEDWRVFARSASDAKGPVAMFLTSLDAVEELNISPNYNIKVIMDFEEEMGSPNLSKAVEDNTDALKSDMLIIFDGPLHDTNKPTLEFGARGISTLILTTYGPIVPQHSGHYGNYAPNPALGLAQLLASMKDSYGRVIIPGFYDGIVINAKTRKILDAVPDDEDFIKDKLQIGSIDSIGTSYQEAIQYPSLNIRGMQSGWINQEARTIIPAWARAEIDIRLVLESNPAKLLTLLKEHIEKQGYYITDKVPTKQERMNYAKVVTLTYDYAYQSFRTDFDSDIGIWLKRALEKAYNDDIIRVRMGGGSVPIAPFVNKLSIPAVIVPTVNIDNNQHSPNENLRIGNYRDGIRTMIAILTEKL